MKTKRIIILSLLLICVAFVQAQLPMGGWKTHFAYGTISQVALSDAHVYALSNGALFSVNKEYKSIDSHSKISGLSEVKIAYIAYAERIKALVIVYENANIDLLYDDGSVENIPDISQKNLAYSKKVNNIFFKDDEAYLCADFGIVVLDLRRKEIAETYYIGENGSAVSVIAGCYFDGNFFAATKEKVYMAAENSLLVNFENWKEETAVATGKNKELFVFDNSAWLLKSDSTLHRYVENAWQPYTAFGKVGKVRVSGNSLLITTASGLKRVNAALGVETIGAFRATDMAYDLATKTCWLAMGAELCEYELPTNTMSKYRPNGPVVSYNYKMQGIGNRLCVIPGARWNDYSRDGYIMFYENGEWTYIAPKDLKWVPANNSVMKEIVPRGLVDIAVDPRDETHYFVASWGMGLYEFRNNEFYKLHNADNGVIESALPDHYPGSGFYNYTRISTLAFDDNGVLWITNDGAANPIKYLTPQGVVKQYSAPSLVSNWSQNMLAWNQNTNQKWILILRGSTYAFVFDDGGTPENPADDRQRLFTSFVDQDGKVLTPEAVQTIAQDDDGWIWIGTTEGLIVAKNPNNVFSQNFHFEQIKIPRNDGTNDADYLLDNEWINDIKVDGMNRKWIATGTSGVFLVSSDGIETIQHFTTENSPLLSNSVLSIGINEETGEVFFGTDNGIISYQSDSATPQETFDSIRAYPNPVRENFTGIITISGLMEDTQVKIVDMAGTVVYATTSRGSLATWDGCGLDGTRVSTGVYFAICTTKDKKVYSRTKILVIK